MKTHTQVRWLLPLLLGVTLRICLGAQMPTKASLCDLQQATKQGEHRPVEVGGIYSTGFELSLLHDDAVCPEQGSWVELDLKSTAHEDELFSLLHTAGKAAVVFYGDFYGPRLPDLTLPESIRRFHAGWGNLEGYRTKLVVHAIQSVKPARADALPRRAPVP